MRLSDDLLEEAYRDATRGHGSNGEWAAGDHAPPRDEAQPRQRKPAGGHGTPVVDGLAMRGLAGDIVRAFAPNTEASPAAILIQFLVGFGSAVGRNPHVCVGETRHHANEFALVVGKSARARKGDSKNAALRTVREADRTWATQSGLSSGEGVVHAVRDEVRKPDRKGGLVVADEGIVDKRLCVIESEFASVLKVMGRDGNTLSPLLRAAWDGDQVLANLSKGAGERATGAHIALIAHATPADLARFLSDTDTANGFANRFAILLVERTQILPNPPPTDPRVIEDLARRVSHAIDVSRSRGELRRTAGADELWRRLYPVLSADRPGLVGDLLARAEAHVLRFSLIYALLDESGVIDIDHICAALALWQACEQSVRTIFSGRSGNKDADRIAEEIGPGEEMSRSNIRETIFANHIAATRLTDAINLLVAMPDWCRIDHDTHGRPAEILRHLALGEPKPHDIGSAS